MFFPLVWPHGLTDGAATLSVKLKAAGLKSFSAEIAGSLPSLTLARGARKAPIAAKGFQSYLYRR